MECRRKPNIVEVFRMIRQAEVLGPTWFLLAITKGTIDIDRCIQDGAVHVYGCTVSTPVGRQKAKIGDYVIRGPDGRLSVCKAVDFEKEYELMK